jgi:hypothetical protein
MADDPPARSVPAQAPTLEPASGARYILHTFTEPEYRGLANRRTQERARMLLACVFAAAFLGTLGGSFFGAVSPHWGSVKDWLQVVLPAETGLFGTALGFYFGSRDRL